jgi:predicted hydrocarbon binding protein
MDSSSKSSKGKTRRGRRRPDAPSISPVLPLLLLETMRDRDRPDEVLEDEDITTSLPRRLGLSEVVRVQISRFDAEVRHRRLQIPSQVEDLLRLVIRRPDCEEIFAEAGRRVAQKFWSERSASVRRSIRFLPRALAVLSAQRAGKQMFSELVGPSAFKISRKPLSLRIESSMTARADPGGAACALYAGALGELLEQYTGRKYRVSHPACSRNGTSPCEWQVEIAA